MSSNFGPNYNLTKCTFDADPEFLEKGATPAKGHNAFIKKKGTCGGPKPKTVKLQVERVPCWQAKKVCRVHFNLEYDGKVLSSFSDLVKAGITDLKLCEDLGIMGSGSCVPIARFVSRQTQTFYSRKSPRFSNGSEWVAKFTLNGKAGESDSVLLTVA